MSVVQDLLDKKKIYYVPQGLDFTVKCTNPDHEDSNPSMRINRTTGIYHCFSCGWKGNILADFGEKIGGIQIKRDKTLELLEQAKLENIGLAFPANAILFQESYRNISAATLKKFKAFTHQEEFPNRIMFPITDITGKIKVFHGRTTEVASNAPKYLSFPRKIKLPLFPARPEIKLGRIILVEGIFDFLNLYDKGLTNAVCMFGVTNFTEEKLHMLKLMGVSGIDIFLDDDRNHPSGKNPGQDNALKIREMVDSYGLATVNIAFPNKDPGDLTLEQVNRLRKQLYG